MKILKAFIISIFGGIENCGISEKDLERTGPENLLSVQYDQGAGMPYAGRSSGP
jgi:hypothetical protein